ncbi:GNAT family N-acetyltransferase [Altererythrobacter salegens]|uniref:GNAT family N-acetyltransferase n=1 Tax=Croceibacterium salegens TaxID=1737568 RepID=A0A6I4SV45_9SPHN|nr:GNAT family N-acetyltransferase [Croceibacterium salegens]MXO59771.1 GNAT family N-acetyltransferase [Croceibacterium salegens]
MGESLIRHAAPGDSPALARLLVQLGYEVTADEVAARLPQMTEEGRAVFVAERDGRVVGCLSTSLMRVIHRPAPVGRISMMVVEDRMRGLGIGAELVAAAERHLLDAGCQVIEVTSALARERAHAFYEKVGYEKTSVRLSRELGRE